MRHLLICVLALSAAAARAGAQSLPLPFEAALGQVRGEVHAEQNRQMDLKQSSLALEISRAADEASQLAWETRLLRNDIAEVRRLARMPGPNPYLGDAIQRLLWGMSYFHERTSYLAAQVVRLSGYVTYRDPALSYPAAQLDDSARRLQTGISVASSDAHAAGAELRLAGRQVEAGSIERKDARVGDSVRMLAFESRRLLGKLRR